MSICPSSANDVKQVSQLVFCIRAPHQISCLTLATQTSSAQQIQYTLYYHSPRAAIRTYCIIHMEKRFYTSFLLLYTALVRHRIGYVNSACNPWILKVLKRAMKLVISVKIYTECLIHKSMLERFCLDKCLPGSVQTGNRVRSPGAAVPLCFLTTTNGAMSEDL